MQRLWYVWLLCHVGAWSPGEAATRLGLFHTQEEVWCWRQRAGIDAQGSHGITCPVRYVSAGDVSTNSPGSWNSIVASRNVFASNPSAGRWTAPGTVGGCVDQASADNWPENPSGAEWSFRLRDAAFYGLVTGSTTDRAAIKAELLWVSSQSFTNWANPSGIWCFGIWESFFRGASALTRVLFAYDYVGRAAFTQAELNQLDRWFFDGADYWRKDMDEGMDGVFVDRWNGNYTPTGACVNAGLTYVGGPESQNYSQYISNRRSATIRFTALAGIYVQQAGRTYTDGRVGTLAQVQQSGRMLAQESVRFNVFPQGVWGEFGRHTGSAILGEEGWSYGGVGIACMLEIMDATARTGDLSLYQYNTNLGVCGTAGTINDGGSRVGENKDALFMVQSYMKYITDVYSRFWPDTSTQDNRIDGRHPRNGSTWHGIHETHMALANVFFQDTFIKQAYTRTHVNSVAYPSVPQGGPPPYQGDNAIFPSTLFMFGQMEGVVNPYNLFASSPPTVTITTPTSSSTHSQSTTPLTTLAGTSSDDVGVTSVTWACPTCTPTSGTATCATCGASATAPSWSVGSIGLAAGANVITVTAHDADTQTGTDALTVTYTPLPTVATPPPWQHWPFLR